MTQAAGSVSVSDKKNEGPGRKNARCQVFDYKDSLSGSARFDAGSN